MKKLFFAFALTSILLSCKKDTTSSNTNSNEVSVSSINCASASIIGEIIKGQPLSDVTVTITYNGGNGKAYVTKSHTSIGVRGLSATLLAGTLANGEGTLVYSISGTPTSSGTANFPIDFGGKYCSISLKVEDVFQSTGINFTSIGAPIGSFQNKVIDVEGNAYRTIKIGTQVWMAENLKVSKYTDGTMIPNITDNTQWQNNNTGAWCYYNNDAVNNQKYGKLYSWYALSPTTNGYKNLCPTGWHVPTDLEWTVLTDYLGGVSVAGGKMKEVGTTSWFELNSNNTNVSLFTALPGGYRHYNGYYFTFGNNAGYWSSSEFNTTYALNRYLSNSNGAASIGSDSKKVGFSVRCLKD